MNIINLIKRHKTKSLDKLQLIIQIAKISNLQHKKRRLEIELAVKNKSLKEMESFLIKNDLLYEFESNL